MNPLADTNRSVLLQLARDSIEEVLQARNFINKTALLKEHPLLGEPIQTTINLYTNKELRASSKSTIAASSLLQEIIIHAKKAAFEDKNFPILTISEYMHCELEIILQTPEGQISQKDPAMLTSVEISS